MNQHPLDPNQLRSGESYVRVVLGECELTGSVLSELSFEACRLQGVK